MRGAGDLQTVRVVLNTNSHEAPYLSISLTIQKYTANERENNISESNALSKDKLYDANSIRNVKKIIILFRCIFPLFQTSLSSLDAIILKQTHNIHVQVLKRTYLFL